MSRLNEIADVSLGEFGLSESPDLQQTPASNPKVMLKVFAQTADSSAPETYRFSFTSLNAARAEADYIKDALSEAIQAAKSASASITPAAPGAGAMAIASAVSSSSGLYDDARLKGDLDLQQSLLKSDPALQRTFMESLRTKPESITSSQFTNQFWSMRIPVLRAHAIDRSQSRGAYNVLSTIKARTEDNVTRLSISKEQIQLIFNQHPLVKRVYDENVPKLNESMFWSKFFLSRLFKKLKGEKIVESDPLDPVLDRYLDQENDYARKSLGSHIPHIIDIEGNEENHSQRRGNQPDLTMRPTRADKVPIIRTLNSLSERIMAHVEPADIDPSEPIGVDEETFNELALRDLQAEAREDRIVLNIKDQKRFFSREDDNTDDADSRLYAAQDPQEVLSSLQVDLDPEMMESDTGGGLNLRAAIGVDEESDSEEEGEKPHPDHVGSRAGFSNATKQILEAISQRRSQTDELAEGSEAAQVAASGLAPALFERLSLTHATTTEFLHHFWLVFLSGDPDRAGEIAKLIESLDRAMGRIKAVADDAESERAKEIERKRKEIRDIYQATGKKLKWSANSVGGGSAVVNEMLAPTVRAVRTAVTRYQQALAAEGLQVEAAA